VPYISSLQKNIWACYVSPYKDELFTSWYMRLSQSHMVKSHSFGKYYFRNQNFWNRDIDNMPAQELKNIIYNNSPLNYEDIENMFLTSYQYFLFEKHNPLGITSGILPLGIQHRKRKNKGLLYCPICLKTKGYYKKQWRLSISYICCECQILLEDSCPNCHSSICFHRLELGTKTTVLIPALNICSNCKHDLSQTFTKANNQEIITQTKIDNILKQGYSEKTHYSFSYFYLLLNVANLMSRKNDTWGRLRKACEIEFGPLPEKHNNFNTWSIHERFPIISASCKIIDDQDFLRYMISEYNLRLSEFNRDRKLVYFFENIFKNF